MKEKSILIQRGRKKIREETKWGGGASNTLLAPTRKRRARKKVRLRKKGRGVLFFR